MKKRCTYTAMEEISYHYTNIKIYVFKLAYHENLINWTIRMIRKLTLIRWWKCFIISRAISDRRHFLKRNRFIRSQSQKRGKKCLIFICSFLTIYSKTTERIKQETHGIIRNKIHKTSTDTGHEHVLIHRCYTSKQDEIAFRSLKPSVYHHRHVY